MSNAARDRYRPSSGSPPLPVHGIRLAAPQTVARDAPFALPLAGSFRLHEAEVRAFGAPILRAIVVVVRAPQAFVFGPAHHEMVFDDDVERDGEAVIGYFHADAAHAVRLRRMPSRLYVSAVMLGHRSEILRVDVVAAPQSVSSAGSGSAAPGAEQRAERGGDAT